MQTPNPPDAPGRWPVVELRQYSLHPGRRDDLVELFDREFIETQEALGMQVLAQCRDLDDANRFVWLRGFAGMDARATSLAAFYDGPVWQAHRDAANATMIDSDDVLLLRPATTAAAPQPIESWPRDADRRIDAAAGGLLIAVFALRLALAAETAESLTRTLAEVVQRSGGAQAGAYVTEPRPNNFTRLPVRAGERVFVWIARFDDPAARDSLAADLRASPFAPSQVLRLAPTLRSRF